MIRQLTTGEHHVGHATTVELLARIDALEHGLSLKQGSYSPHSIAVDNFWLMQRNNELEAEIEKLNKMLKYEVQDSCDTESSVKAEAKKVLPANLVDGDDCCVPDVTEIVAMLVAEVERLRKQSLFRPISEMPVLVATLPQPPQESESGK